MFRANARTNIKDNHAIVAVNRPVLHDVRLLSSRLEVVINLYLIERFSVNSESLRQQATEIILANLLNDPNYYRNQLNKAAEKESGQTWAGSSLSYVSMAVSLIDQKARVLLENNGLHRVHTLQWLHAVRTTMNTHLELKDKIEKFTQLDDMSLSLTLELTALFSTLNRIMITDAEKSLDFTVQYNNKSYAISGLQNNKSPLRELLQEHIIDVFNCDNILSRVNNELGQCATELTQIQVNAAQQENERQRLIKLQHKNVNLSSALVKAGLSIQELQKKLETQEVSIAAAQLPADPLVMSTEPLENERRTKLKEYRRFPILKKMAKNGLTQAQINVIDGEVECVANFLEDNTNEMNVICLSNDSVNSKKSLLELAMFDSKKKLPIMKVILQHRPYLFGSALPVFDTIMQRLQEVSVPKELEILFCQYVISQKTCSPDAREDLRLMIEKIDNLYSVLKLTHLKGMMDEMKNLIEYSRLLANGYLLGDFAPLNDVLKNENEMPNAAQYEVLWDPAKRLLADKQNVPGLRYKLEEIINQSLKICATLKPENARIVGAVVNSVVVLDEPIKNAASAAVNQSPSPKLFAPKYSNNPQQAQLIQQYSDLIDSVSRVISRFGVVLNTKGFNEFQRAEILFQNEREASLMHPFPEHEEVQERKASQGM
jgi:hypothetical protein